MHGGDSKTDSRSGHAHTDQVAVLPAGGGHHPPVRPGVVFLVPNQRTGPRAGPGRGQGPGVQRRRGAGPDRRDVRRALRRHPGSAGNLPGAHRRRRQAAPRRAKPHIPAAAYAHGHRFRRRDRHRRRPHAHWRVRRQRQLRPHGLPSRPGTDQAGRPAGNAGHVRPDPLLPHAFRQPQKPHAIRLRGPGLGPALRLSRPRRLSRGLRSPAATVVLKRRSQARGHLGHHDRRRDPAGGGLHGPGPAHGQRPGAWRGRAGHPHGPAVSPKRPVPGLERQNTVHGRFPGDARGGGQTGPGHRGLPRLRPEKSGLDRAGGTGAHRIPGYGHPGRSDP